MAQNIFRVPKKDGAVIDRGGLRSIIRPCETYESRLTCRGSWPPDPHSVTSLFFFSRELFSNERTDPRLRQTGAKLQGGYAGSMMHKFRDGRMAMEPDKDIRFSEKKVDESWKEQAESVKVKAATSQPAAKSKPAETSKVFLSLVQSLGYQALMNLGEIPNPMTQQTELNPEGAKESIDLLIALRDKTQGNLSDEEKKMLETLITQLQIKFSQSV